MRDVDDVTEIDRSTGAVRSVQSAEVVLPAERIDAMWSPEYLERLARTYWRFLTRATLGLIRVYYTEGERYVCLLFRPLKLLTFQAPEYEMDDRRGVVRWRIERGPARRPPRARRRRLPGDRRRAPARRRSRARSTSPSRSRWPTSTRAIASRLSRFVYTQHAVAHPRDRHPRLPALAGPPGPRAVAGRALRVRPTTSPTRRRRRRASAPTRDWRRDLRAPDRRSKAMRIPTLPCSPPPCWPRPPPPRAPTPSSPRPRAPATWPPTAATRRGRRRPAAGAGGWPSARPTAR